MFKTAAIMLGAARMGPLDAYQYKIERLAQEYVGGSDGVLWGLFLTVENRARDRYAATLRDKAERGLQLPPGCKLPF